MKKIKIVEPEKWKKKIVAEAQYKLPDDCRGGICIDAGCNIGDFIINHKNRFDKYICYDVFQENIDEAIKNTKDFNVDAEFILKAVWSKSNEVINVYGYNPCNSDNLNHFGNSGNISVHSTEPGAHGEGWKPENTIGSVETISLEEIIETYGTINLLKIDVEGSEYDFLLDKDLSKINFITGEFHREPSDILRIVEHIKKTHNVVSSSKHVYTFRLK